MPNPNIATICLAFAVVFAAVVLSFIVHTIKKRNNK